VPEQTPEARIRDLERRLDLDPGSRLFVSLAEEYRKVGRIKDALSSLQKGLLAHPGYVAAQVALGRVYVEAKQTTDAIATFTKVLQSDPGNLVAARSLADIYYDRGDNLEALKKYKLYRALSGDRKVDELIAKIEPKVAPLPITPLKKILTAEPPPPPPSFQDTQVAARRPTMSRIPVPQPELSDPFDVTSLAFDPGEDSTGKGASPSDGPFSAVPTRDVFIAPPPPRASAPTAQASPDAAAEGAAQSPAPAAPPEPAIAAPAAPAPAAASARDDAEETLSIRPQRAEAPEPAGDMFTSEPRQTELPEPPPLFIATAVPAAPFVAADAVPAAPFVAGSSIAEESAVADASPSMSEVSEATDSIVKAEPARPSAAAASLEPRQFPPPYDEDATAAPAAPAAAASAAPPAAVDSEERGAAPSGRALADLYYAQGHYADALQIYDDLVTRHPFDDDLKRMRRDAEARLLPAASAPGAASQDPGLERRLARVRVLKRWLGRIQAPDHSAAAPGP
jgi:tetratricopeptide (TPR) repeat protein